MKKYKLSKLKILTIQNNEKILHDKTKIICEHLFNVFTEEYYFKEIFTEEKITMSDILKKDIIEEDFSDYYPDLVKKCKGYKFSKIELLSYYDELNKIELLTNIDEEDIKNYLDNKYQFEESKIYAKKM